MENDNFLFNKSWRDAIRDLPPEIKLEVYEGIMDYCLEGKIPELSLPALVAFNFIKQDYDRQRDNYKKTRGGNPNFKKGQSNPYYKKKKITGDNSGITGDNSGITGDKQQIEIETEIENIISPDGECEEQVPEGLSSPTPRKSSQRRFQKPTVEEIDAYCKERGNGIDAQGFFDYYESKGWVVGKSPMKDWKAAVRNWERMDRDTGFNKPRSPNPPREPTRYTSMDDIY